MKQKSIFYENHHENWQEQKDRGKNFEALPV